VGVGMMGVSSTNGMAVGVIVGPRAISGRAVAGAAEDPPALSVAGITAGLLVQPTANTNPKNKPINLRFIADLPEHPDKIYHLIRVDYIQIMQLYRVISVCAGLGKKLFP